MTSLKKDLLCLIAGGTLTCLSNIIASYNSDNAMYSALAVKEANSISGQLNSLSRDPIKNIVKYDALLHRYMELEAQNPNLKAQVVEYRSNLWASNIAGSLMLGSFFFIVIPSSYKIARHLYNYIKSDLKAARETD